MRGVLSIKPEVCGCIGDIVESALCTKKLLDTEVVFVFNGVEAHISNRSNASLNFVVGSILEAVQKQECKVYFLNF